MSNGFNKLELAILEWLKTIYNDQDLSVQVDLANFSKREWTKVGYFVHFEVPKDVAPINPNNFGSRWPIDGPGLKSEDIEYGGDSLIWGTNGYIDCIEMYAFGNFFKEQVEEFELVIYDRNNNTSN